VGVGYRAELKGRQVTFALGARTGRTTSRRHRHRRRQADARDGDRWIVSWWVKWPRTSRLRKPDPYKQKGVRYTGEVLKKKVGKTGA
jgi:large subunit ribosomal protein L6